MQILVCDKEERDLIGAFYTLLQAHPRFDGLSMLMNDCDDKRKMILVAGLEGTAAAQASDFAFTKFHFLRRALLVHGHWFVVAIVVFFIVIIIPGIMFESVF